jgi:ribosome-associated toxin RatA of RatAB toxin-antitoxin module
MSAPTPPPVVKQKRRRTRLLFIPVTLLALGLLALLFVYVRGTWATAQPRNPSSVSEGPVSQLVLWPKGGKAIRCAILLPYPRQPVWDVVTDYGHYSDFLPYLKDTEAARKADAWELKGQAASAFSGDWPFDITITEDTEPSLWRVWWDDRPTQGKIAVNRGTWELTESSPNQTLLVLTLQAEVHSTPTFFLRNILLFRLKQVVRAVEKRLQFQTQP